MSSRILSFCFFSKTFFFLCFPISTDDTSTYPSSTQTFGIILGEYFLFPSVSSVFQQVPSTLLQTLSQSTHGLSQSHPQCEPLPNLSLSCLCHLLTVPSLLPSNQQVHPAVILRATKIILLHRKSGHALRLLHTLQSRKSISDCKSLHSPAPTILSDFCRLTLPLAYQALETDFYCFLQWFSFQRV